LEWEHGWVAVALVLPFNFKRHGATSKNPLPKENKMKRTYISDNGAAMRITSKLR